MVDDALPEHVLDRWERVPLRALVRRGVHQVGALVVPPEERPVDVQVVVQLEVGDDVGLRRVGGPKDGDPVALQEGVHPAPLDVDADESRHRSGPRGELRWLRGVLPLQDLGRRELRVDAQGVVAADAELLHGRDPGVALEADGDAVRLVRLAPAPRLHNVVHLELLVQRVAALATHAVRVEVLLAVDAPPGHAD